MAAPMDEFSDRNQSRFSSLCFRYIPLVGSTSIIGFSAYVMNPKVFKSILGNRDFVAANSLWFNAHIGVGLYVYSRRHMYYATVYKRLLYSTFATVTFNFGSVLFWAATKAVLPKNDVLKTVVGIVSGLAFIVIGKSYLAFIDGNTRQDEV